MPATKNPVKVTEFGKSRQEVMLPRPEVLVDQLLKDCGIKTDSQRVAVNGFPADSKTTVVEGDEVTVHPFVQGG